MVSNEVLTVHFCFFQGYRDFIFPWSCEFTHTRAPRRIRSFMYYHSTLFSAFVCGHGGRQPGWITSDIARHGVQTRA